MKIMIHDICTSFTPNISPLKSEDPKKGKWQTSQHCSGHVKSVILPKHTFPGQA